MTVTVTKLFFFGLLAIGFASCAEGFCFPGKAFGVTSNKSSGIRSSTLLQSKKNPKGAPITVQEDEDMAMWIEGEDGKAKEFWREN